MRLFGSTALTSASTEKAYHFQVHLMRLPGSRRPLPSENQNLEVIAGSTNASNTSATGRRISISAPATNSVMTLNSALGCKVRRAELRRNETADQPERPVPG